MDCQHSERFINEETIRDMLHWETRPRNTPLLESTTAYSPPVPNSFEQYTGVNLTTPSLKSLYISSYNETTDEKPTIPSTSVHSFWDQTSAFVDTSIDNSQYPVSLPFFPDPEEFDAPPASSKPFCLQQRSQKRGLQTFNKTLIETTTTTTTTTSTTSPKRPRYSTFQSLEQIKSGETSTATRDMESPEMIRQVEPEISREIVRLPRVFRPTIRRAADPAMRFHTKLTPSTRSAFSQSIGGSVSTLQG